MVQFICLRFACKQSKVVIEVKALAAADTAKWSSVPLGKTDPANPEQPGHKMGRGDHSSMTHLSANKLSAESSGRGMRRDGNSEEERPFQRPYF